ncbi:MAG: type II secretion system F family protein [Gammaproteobacteria bacterium]|nr:type II secretion system F family protein [Gammaproteobacteria bacterium]
MKNKKPLIRIETKINSMDIAQFSRQLATMIAAGIPLITAIESIQKEHENISFIKTLSNIIKNLKEGRSFSECLLLHNKIFDHFFCNLIRAGEQSGTLGIMLNKVSTHLNKSNNIKNKMKKAFAYPVTILAITFLISTLSLFFIVPEFKTLFTSFNAQLPTLTRFIIKTSSFIQNFWWIIIMLTILIMTILKNKKNHNPSVKLFLDQSVLKIPFFGAFVQKAIIVTLLSTLATLLEAGIPMIKALDLTSSITNNSVFQNALQKIQEEIKMGQSLHIAFKNTFTFPNKLLQMIDVGEKSGALESMLNNIANLYENDLDYFIANLSQLMEPIIMLIIGSIVGVFVLALYLPIFKLGSVF